MLLNVGGYQHGEQLQSELVWTIVDIEPTADIVLNLRTDALPLEDNSVEAIYTSHTLEHIDLHCQRRMFAEFYRVLKPDGRIRIVVPDFDIAIRAYVNGDAAFLHGTRVVADAKIWPDIPLLNMYSWAASYHFNGDERVNVHMMPFNRQVLEVFLIDSGFKNISFAPYAEHSPVFKGLDLAGHAHTSIAVEASKPNPS